MSKKEITLEKAFEILRQCAGVILEERFLVPSLFEIEGDGENVWMSVHWIEQYKGDEVIIFVSFSEDDNKKVILDGCNLTVVNTDGEEEVLTLMREWFPEEQ